MHSSQLHLRFAAHGMLFASLDSAHESSYCCGCVVVAAYGMILKKSGHNQFVQEYQEIRD